MNFKWETQNERLRRSMAISPKKKLEWLYEINEFVVKYSTAGGKKIRRAVREKR